MSFTVFCPSSNPRVFPVLITAELAGVPVEMPPFTMGTDNKTPEFLAINPIGRVPAMRTPGGISVWESPALTRAIARSVPAAELAGATPLDAAAVDAWMSVVASDLVPAITSMVTPHLYPSLKYEAEAAAKGRAGMEKVLPVLERVLLSQTYLVGERVTLADVWVVFVLSILMEHILDAPARAAMPNVMRYFTTLAAQPAFAKVLGEVKLYDPIVSAFGVEPPDELERCIPFKWSSDGGCPAPPTDVAWARSFLRRLCAASHREPELISLYALRKPDMVRLVGAAKDVLSRCPNVVEVGVPPAGRVRVVGDLHGNFHDLLHLLAVGGLPSEENIYIFAGDYVDRGNWGVEVVLALFALKLWRPEAVHLLRGNHETSSCVERYGFATEVARKYGSQSLGGFLSAFRELPIAAVVVTAPAVAPGGVAAAAAARGGRGGSRTRGVARPVRRGASGRASARWEAATAASGSGSGRPLPIWERPLVPGERRVLALHGGIWRDRPSSLVPAGAGSGAAARRVALGTLSTLAATPRRAADPEGDAVEDAIWSDPSTGDGAPGGVVANSLRGAGVLYGSGAAERWLRDNRLAGLLRAHEGPDIRATRPGMSDMDAGWAVDMEWPSGAYVATVFSAADYLGRGNAGGYATLAGRDDPAAPQGRGAPMLPAFSSFPSRGRPAGEDWACPPVTEERPMTPRAMG
ncbi:hypothetical protein MMPV_001197 [Pyropia vietnamensis]